MNTKRRRAIAALWSVQGLGPKTLLAIETAFPDVGELLTRPVRDWVDAITIWKGETKQRVMSESLERRADRLEAYCRGQKTAIVFSGDPAWPTNLDRLGSSAPPLLFLWGRGADAPRRRRLAVVGARRASRGVLPRVLALAKETAANAIGVISGAAEGVDTAAHLGALEAEGETWAFMGSALDEIDATSRRVALDIREAGGSVFSEFPPGFRANDQSFVIRNRLIAASSDAVLVARAGEKSGSLHTADWATDLGIPLLAVPGEPWDELSRGSNTLLRSGRAKPWASLDDVFDAVGLTGSVSPPEPLQVDESAFGPIARDVFTLLKSGAADFEAILEQLPNHSSAQVSAALVELEVCGAVLHKGGRRYEKR